MGRHRFSLLAFPGSPQSARIFPDQVRLLYRGALEAYIATAINVVLLAAIQRYRIPSQIVLAWVLYMFVVTTGRALLVWKYWRSGNQVEHAWEWNQYYLAGSGLAGAGWGSAGVFLYPPDSLAHQVFLAFVIGGMAAGGVAVLTPRIEVFFAFFLPAVSPIVVRFFVESDSYHTTMTAMILLYSGALLVTARRFHRTIQSALELRCENVDLVRHLMGAKEQADTLNEDLRQEIIERRKTETALQDTCIELERTVEERTADKQQLRSLSSQLRRNEQRIRQRLATELHDNIAQTLAFCNMKLQALIEKEKDCTYAGPLKDVTTHLNEALTSTRGLMYDLRPFSLTTCDDFLSAVHWVAEKAQRHGMHVIIDEDGKPKVLEEPVLTVLYQSIHEAVFNVLKHADTKRARVALRSRRHHVRVFVSDKGQGFDPSTLSLPNKDGCFGLFNMREQLHQINGELKIVSVPGKGTTLIITVPGKLTESEP
jgi:signal transduction histidine kinase